MRWYFRCPIVLVNDDDDDDDDGDKEFCLYSYTMPSVRTKMRFFGPFSPDGGG